MSLDETRLPTATPVAQSVTQPMPVRDCESHREKDREMLARVKVFGGDDDKLLAGYQQMLTLTLTLSQASLGSLIRSSRIVLKSRDE